MAKYLVTLDTEDGPFLTSPLGGVVVFDFYEDAAKAANRGGKRWVHSAMPIAYYSAQPQVDPDPNPFAPTEQCDACLETW